MLISHTHERLYMTDLSAENYNKDAHDLLEKALYMLQDGVVIINRRRTIVYINKAGQHILEKQLDRLPQPGEDFMSTITPGRKEEVGTYIDHAFCNKTTIYELNYPFKNDDTWFEFGFYPMPGENGFITHVCIRGRNITDRVLLERTLEKQRKAQKNSIIKATLDAQEKERSEIGRELHDNVNQVLTTVKLYNEICLTEEKVNKAMLQKSVQQINYCIETIRSLSKTLASPRVEEMGLKETIRELVDTFNNTRKVNINYYCYGIKDDRISQDMQTCIYRIAQEQLTNIIKYANASVVDVLLVATSTNLALRIQDNGNGFDLSQKRKGVGITNMISRAESLGGLLEFETSPGNGCSLMVELPIPPASEEEGSAQGLH
jgi:signal transduction histidine kinase